MKLSCIRASKLFFRSIPVPPISCSSISPPPTSHKPQTPLFLRPPAFSATLSDLRKWHHWAKTLASSVGSAFQDSDNGPDSSLLHRELSWLIEDALQNPKSLSTHFEFPEDNNGEVMAALRAGLEDLYALWKQRIEERRPFQYIVGCEHWRDLVLSVEEGVLIPRPETELIVDLAGDAIKDSEEDEGLWADLGTGSGAIAIGVGRVLGSRGRVIATDLSPVAVAVAAFNVRRYNLQDKIEVRQGHWFEPLKDVEGELSGLVSNPPYIPSEDMSGLQAEVGKHEPRLALDGGANGMEDLLHLCNGALSLLKPGGFFAFETNGDKQCKYLVDYMETKTSGNFCNVKVISDFSGRQRFLTGFRAR